MLGEEGEGLPRVEDPGYSSGHIPASSRGSSMHRVPFVWGVSGSRPLHCEETVPGSGLLGLPGAWVSYWESEA